jgi:capsular polysaccharide biosynthesis protein
MPPLDPDGPRATSPAGLDDHHPDHGPGDEPTPLERLGHVAVAIRRRWRWCVVAFAVTVVPVALVSHDRPPVYQATARVLLKQVDPAVSAVASQPNPQSADIERAINTDVQLATLRPVASQVARRLRPHVSPAALLDEVDVATSSNSNLLSIEVQDKDARRAAAIANAFAGAYVVYRRQQARADYAPAIAGIARRLAHPRGPAPAPQAAAALRSARNRLQIAQDAETGGATVAEPAAVPTGPKHSRLPLGLIAAVLVGAILAVLLAVTLEGVDGRIGDERDAEETMGLPVLAAVPRRKRLLGDPDDVGEVADSLACLASLGPFRWHSEPSVVFLSGVDGAAGGLTVTLGLAQTLAAAGRQVIVIEADLRRAELADRVGASPAGGLFGVLTEERPLEAELVDVDPCGEAPFRVLPAGGWTRAAQARLSGIHMAAVLEEARAHADIVLVAAPPIDRIGHALGTAGMADGAILVVRAGATSADRAEAAARTVRAADAALLGIVLTGTRAPRASRRPAGPRDPRQLVGGPVV